MLVRAVMSLYEGVTTKFKLDQDYQRNFLSPEISVVTLIIYNCG